MKRVYKYPLLTVDAQDVDLPKGAEIKHVGVQNERICLWALVDPSVDATERRRFNIRGTGHDVEQGNKHIGTIMTADQQLVFHVFEETP